MTDDQAETLADEDLPQLGYYGSLLTPERWSYAAAAAVASQTTIEVWRNGRGFRQRLTGARPVGPPVPFAAPAGAEDQKGARRRGAWICFQNESGFSLLPVVRGTWAPRGQTPVLRHQFSWTRMSMADVLAYRPDRSRAKLVFQTKPGSYNTESLIDFLTELRRHLRGKPIVLIWDGLSAHRSKDMKAWLATQQHWLTVEALPGYAHDLNPLELVWATSKPPNWPTSAPNTSAKLTPLRTPDYTASAAATTCVSTSSTTPAFVSDEPSPKYRKIFELEDSVDLEALTGSR